MILRKAEIFHVNNANTEKYKNSAIPFMQRLFNEHEQEKSSEDTCFRAPLPS